MRLQTGLGIVKLCLFALALFLAMISGLGEFGRLFPQLDTLNHFRPFTMIGSIIALAGILLVHRRPLRRHPVVWLALFAVAVQGLFLGPELVKSAMAQNAMASHPVERKAILRIASLNVWGRNNAQTRAADALVALDPDIIVLQEVWRGLEHLVTRLQKTHPHRSDCIAVSRCNVAILSRHPIRNKKIYRPHFPGSRPWTVPVVFAGLDLKASEAPSEVMIFATHLTWPNQVPLQKTQMKQLAEAVRGVEAKNTILIGDFNSTPWSHGLAYLGEVLDLRRITFALPTWPSDLAPRVLRIFRNGLAEYGLKPSPLYAPFLPIDHAFIGADLQAKSVRRAKIPGSDHYALVIDIARNKE